MEWIVWKDMMALSSSCIYVYQIEVSSLWSNQTDCLAYWNLLPTWKDKYIEIEVKISGISPLMITMLFYLSTQIF